MDEEKKDKTEENSSASETKSKPNDTEKETIILPKKKKSFSEIRDDLLLNMRKNRINYSIVIPDNIPNLRCADLETVADLTKNKPNLYMVGTLQVIQINKKNLLKIEKLFRQKTIKGF